MRKTKVKALLSYRGGIGSKRGTFQGFHVEEAEFLCDMKPALDEHASIVLERVRKKLKSTEEPLYEEVTLYRKITDE